jgi:serine/threonine protein phosphatase 1
MKTYAIGDVHGCLTALETLLAKIPLKPDDQIVFLGDLIDRGPDSRGVVELILRLRQERPVQVILGNHEEMLMHSRKDINYADAWRSFGGQEMLQSYGWSEEDSIGWPHAIPDAHWNFFESSFVDYVELPEHILIHGSLLPKLPLNEQPWDDLRWEKWNDPEPHLSGKTVICGHTSQLSGVPLSVGHAICIDTWVYGKGFLTALDLETHEYHQSTEKGEYRSGVLPPETEHTNPQR